MARTKRTPCPTGIDSEKPWKNTADHKGWMKPGRKAKVYLHKGAKAKAKMAVKTAKDFDEMVIDPVKKTDIWNYN
jgi:hypothetical protein